MKVMIIVDPNPIQRIVSPHEKIYDYMSRLLDLSPQKFIVKISPTTEKIQSEEDFQKYKNFASSLIAFYVLDLSGGSITYNDCQLKKQTSIVQQFGYCSQESEEIQLNRSQILNSTKSFNEEKIESLNFIANNLSQQNIDNSQDSTPQIQYQKCQFCLQNFDESFIETPCQHIFHIKCFRLIVEHQVQQKESTLICLCKQKLNFRIIFFLDDKYEAEAFKQRFLLNQLSVLEKNLKTRFENEYRKCINIKSCNFFYLHLPFIQKKHQYCPYCLWQNDK